MPISNREMGSMYSIQHTVRFIWKRPPFLPCRCNLIIGRFLLCFGFLGQRIYGICLMFCTLNIWYHPYVSNFFRKPLQHFKKARIDLYTDILFDVIGMQHNRKQKLVGFLKFKCNVLFSYSFSLHHQHYQCTFLFNLLLFAKSKITFYILITLGTIT